MALIKCPECGATVSDKAAACPQCGMPIASAASEKKIKVHFEREKVVFGRGIYGTVIIDGLPVGTATNGASFDVMLTPGTHNVIINTGLVGRGETTITSNGQSLEIPENAKSVYVTIVLKKTFNAIFGADIGGELQIDDVSIRR